MQYPAGKSGGYQIPDGVTSIGDEAFAECSGLTSVVIEDGVTSIGDEAFSGCSSLTSIVIPWSVTSIGDEAFAECENLAGVYFAGFPPEPDGPDIFRNCPCIIHYVSGTVGWGEQYGGRPTAVWNQQEHPQ